MTARPAAALPGVWGLTTAVPASAGAAVAVSGAGSPARPDDAALRERVRAALSAVWGEDPGPLGLARRCPACGSGEHGAPRLTGLPAGRRVLVSLSGVADDDGAPLRVAAWWMPGPAPAPPGSGLGLDLERIDAPALAAPDGLGGVGFSTAERTWLAGLAPADRPAARARLWTRKEALVKAAGTGFTGDPADVPALSPGPGDAVVDLGQELLRAAGLPPAVRGALALRVPTR